MQASTSKSGKHLKNIRIEVAIVKEQVPNTDMEGILYCLQMCYYMTSKGTELHG